MFLILYILSVLWLASAIVFIAYKYPDKNVEVTPLAILSSIVMLIIVFVPVMNAFVAFLLTMAICSKLYDDGYFDKFKEWWITPLFKNKD